MVKTTALDGLEIRTEVHMKTLRIAILTVPLLMTGIGVAFAQSSTEYPPGPSAPAGSQRLHGGWMTTHSSIYDHDGFLRLNADGAGGAGSGSDGSGNQGRGGTER